MAKRPVAPGPFTWPNMPTNVCAQQHVYRLAGTLQRDDHDAHRQLPIRPPVDGELDCTDWEREFELPGFITSSAGASAKLRCLPAGRLPGDPHRRQRRRKAIANIENSKLSEDLQRKQLDLLASLNRERLKKTR